MISLQDTLTLNNRAVELFNSNDIREAVKTYHHSLCTVRALLACPQHSSPTTIANAPPQRERFHHAVKPTENLRTRADELFLYQNTLILQEAPVSTSQNDALRVYCAAILFNTAILYHLISKQTGNSAAMNKAEELYKSSLQFLQGLSPNSNDTVILLIVVNQNNLALIQLEKGLVIEAGQRLQFLSHLFHTIRPTIRGVFTLEEAKGMFSNTLLRNGVISSPAA